MFYYIEVWITWQALPTEGHINPTALLSDLRNISLASFWDALISGRRKRFQSGKQEVMDGSKTIV
jgi:hypothetical protein